MLSKEEIPEYLNDLEKALKDNDSFYWQEDMYELIQIIRKEEPDKKKLIEKLEKVEQENKQLKEQNNNNVVLRQMIKEELDKAIKEIDKELKGENDERNKI